MDNTTHNFISSKFTLAFDFIDEATGDQTHVELPLVMVWAIRKVANAFGPYMTEFVALIGAHAVKAAYAVDGQQIEPSSHQGITDQDRRRVQIMVREVARAAQDKWPKSEDLLIEASYEALRQGLLTRGQAAEFASELLGRTVTMDTWRKRVDRWADQKKLPKVEIYQRKTDKVS